MEHDQRVCPRCGEPAGEYRFCESCRSQIAGTPANDTSSPATQALREVLRLEEALAAASKGISDRIAARTPGAALQVEPEPAPALDADTAPAAIEIAKLPTSAVEASHPGREVARLEDVLTIAPASRSVAPPPAAPEPEAPVASEPEPPVAEPEAPAPVAAPDSTPIFLTAPAERKGFWFDYMPATEDVETPEAVEAVADPEAVEAVADPGPIAPASVPSSGPNHWVAALCLIALLGLVALLTGRSARRAG